jgi:8-oxo-dGTP pyrophosphatase MutT (NUDIX family)
VKHDELIDLVDANGAPRIRSITRGEVQARLPEFLARGLYQPIVIVVVIDRRGTVTAHERGSSKGLDGGGDIDHVCGVIPAGETWVETATREAAEEIGVSLERLTLLSRGVNAYHRFRILATAEPIGDPHITNPSEVSRIIRASHGELLQLQRSGQSRFVKGFFEDLERALSADIP